jgi:anthranilate/para-aminobenzoate synthase component II
MSLILKVAVYDKILLSPGPGVPEEAGLLKEVIRKYAPSKKYTWRMFGTTGNW